MTLVNNFQVGQNSWAFASASASASTGNANYANTQNQQNPMNMLQGFGLIFAGMDLIDNGALDGSILQNLMGQKPGMPGQQGIQPPMAQGPQQGFAPQQQQFAPPPPPRPPMQQQQQQQNPMMQMMQMMMQFFQMMMQMMQQMMGQGQQQQNGMPGQQAQAPFANAAAAAGPNGAAASANAGSPFAAQSPFQFAGSPTGSAAAAAASTGNGASAAAAAYAGPNGAYAAASASAAAGTGQQIEIGKDGKGIWGDPHYDIKFDKNGDGKVGKDEGVKFDHKGKDGNTYSIFKGDGLDIKGRYDKWENPKAPQIIGEVSINDQANITKDGKLKLNGQEKQLKDGEKVQLQDGSQIEKSKDGYKVISKEGDANVNIKCNGKYIDVDPEGKFGNLGGIVGDAMQKAMNGEKLPGNDYWTQNYDLGKVL